MFLNDAASCFSLVTVLCLCSDKVKAQKHLPVLVATNTAAMCPEDSLKISTCPHLQTLKQRLIHGHCYSATIPSTSQHESQVINM